MIDEPTTMADLFTQMAQEHFHKTAALSVRAADSYLMGKVAAHSPHLQLELITGLKVRANPELTKEALSFGAIKNFATNLGRKVTGRGAAAVRPRPNLGTAKTMAAPRPQTVVQRGSMGNAPTMAAPSPVSRQTMAPQAMGTAPTMQMPAQAMSRAPTMQMPAQAPSRVVPRGQAAGGPAMGRPQVPAPPPGLNLPTQNPVLARMKPLPAPNLPATQAQLAQEMKNLQAAGVSPEQAERLKSVFGHKGVNTRTSTPVGHAGKIRSTFEGMAPAGGSGRGQMIPLYMPKMSSHQGLSKVASGYVKYLEKLSHTDPERAYYLAKQAGIGGKIFGGLANFAGKAIGGGSRAASATVGGVARGAGAVQRGGSRAIQSIRSAPANIRQSASAAKTRVGERLGGLKQQMKTEYQAGRMGVQRNAYTSPIGPMPQGYSPVGNVKGYKAPVQGSTTPQGWKPPGSTTTSTPRATAADAATSGPRPTGDAATPRPSVSKVTREAAGAGGGGGDKTQQRAPTPQEQPWKFPWMKSALLAGTIGVPMVAMKGLDTAQSVFGSQGTPTHQYGAAAPTPWNRSWQM